MDRLKKDGFVKAEEARCTIYALLNKGEVVYIGQSVDYRGRVRAHRSKGKIQFDEVWVRFVIRRNMDLIEEKMIKKYKPKHNGTYVTHGIVKVLVPRPVSRLGRAPQAKFTREEVLAMRKDFADGMSKKAIARKYDTSDMQVYAIVTRKTWAWLIDEKSIAPRINNKNGAKLNWDKARDIRKKSQLGVTARELAMQHGVSRGCINDVIANRSWIEEASIEDITAL